MNLEEMKETLYDITASFFAGASVIWAEQAGTKPPPPYVTLKVGNAGRSLFPVVDEDGTSHYPSSALMEVNLYTKGNPVTAGDGVTGSYSNTALSDLSEFFLYVSSDEITDMLSQKGMDILLIPPVRDLTALENSSSYRYRAMAEATITFDLGTEGRYGIGNVPMVPNASGGGTQEMASGEVGFFVEAEVEEAEETRKETIEGGQGDEE